MSTLGVNESGPRADGAPAIESEEPGSEEPGAEETGPGSAADTGPAVERPSYWFLAIVTILSAVSDLASKEWAQHALTGAARGGGQKRVVVIEGYFDFVYAQNPGGAWSMLRSLPELIRRPFFLLVSTVAVVFIISIYARVDRRQWALKWGLPLALGGAIGNLVDRARLGYVVDFIHVWVKRGGDEFHWPTFNVADVWIVVGVAMMAIDLFFVRHGEPDEEPPREDDAEGGSISTKGEPSVEPEPIAENALCPRDADLLDPRDE